MYQDLFNLILSFLEGLALIISPCILPILPIILAGSLTGSKKRPLGIIVGFVLLFSLFTFFSRQLVEYSGVDLGLIRHVAYGLLLLLGLVMMSTYLTEKFILLTQGLTRLGSHLSSSKPATEDFLSGLIFGSLVALIWTPCAGPILAAVIVQTVIQKTTFMSFLTILAFAIGAAGPMLIIALCGRSIMPKLNFFKTHPLLFRKLLGAIIMVTVFYLLYFEGSAALPSTNNRPTKTALELQQGLIYSYPAPAIDGISAWINSQPLQLQALKGKVVLIDFWTYSCINCLRTLPYLKDWYNKYHDQGLVIIGVHSPEFDFEKDLANVKAAVAKDGILYPVALDNQFVTWRNFKNSYWPAHYLINKNGDLVYVHFGEGAYDTTENNIRFLLGLKGPTLTTATSEGPAAPALTPETYLGYARAEQFSSPETITKNVSRPYTFPAELAINAWALQGPWEINSDRIVATGKNAILKLHFLAGKVFIVMGSANSQPLRVNLLLNGETVVSPKGKDVVQSTIEVRGPRLYEALVLDHPMEGILQISPSAPGLEVYTFTFGR